MTLTHTRITLGWMIVAALATRAFSETLTLRVDTEGVSKAVATGQNTRSEIAGAVRDESIVFDKLLPNERYDAALTLAGGRETRLIDLAWHSDERAATATEPLSDEDRAAIGQFLTEIKAFTNRHAILKLVGTSQRAVALVELYRDTDFHARKGDEIVWRIEVWYFEFQAGGWAKVQQQDRVIERARFQSREEFDKRRKSISWVGVETPLKVSRGKDSEIEVKSKD